MDRPLGCDAPSVRDIEAGFSYHCGHTPDVGTCAPFGSEDDLWRAVLSGLDIVREVVTDPASITQIGNLYGNDLYVIARRVFG